MSVPCLEPGRLRPITRKIQCLLHVWNLVPDLMSMGRTHA